MNTHDRVRHSSNTLTTSNYSCQHCQQQNEACASASHTNRAKKRIHKRSYAMQWFILVTFALCLLGSIAFSIVALIITRNLFTLAIPVPLVFAMRPIIHHVFS